MSLQSLFNLSGKTALVTGCDRGIGKGYATALAEAGADIIGVSLNLGNESETAQEVVALGKKFVPYSADLSDRTALYNFIKLVKLKTRRLIF